MIGGNDQERRRRRRAVSIAAATISAVPPFVAEQYPRRGRHGYVLDGARRRSAEGPGSRGLWRKAGVVTSKAHRRPYAPDDQQECLLSAANYRMLKGRHAGQPVDLRCDRGNQLAEQIRMDAGESRRLQRFPPRYLQPPALFRILIEGVAAGQLSRRRQPGWASRLGQYSRVQGASTSSRPK